jgi:hypothetical protein
MKSEKEIRNKLRELRLASLQIARPNLETWIEALEYVLDEKKMFS